MIGLVILLVVLLALALLTALLWRPVTPALAAGRAALIYMAACTLLIGLFIAGETVADPGGWRAVALIALWLVPLGVLSLLAWYRPGWAVIALAILLAATVAVAGWFAADPEGWRSFEDQHGPVRVAISFILSLPAALAGWHRPRTGAVLLLVLGTVPPAISAAGSGYGGTSLAAVSTPAALSGLLYLLAAALAGRGARPGPGPAPR